MDAAHFSCLSSTRRLAELPPGVSRAICSTNCLLARRARSAMPLLAQPLSPWPARPACGAWSSLGSRSLCYPAWVGDASVSLAREGAGARRRAYPRIDAAARSGARTESPKVRNRRMQKKFNGTAARPRLSVFCSNRQLYAMLVDDHGKKILFYGSTLQRSICGDPPCGAAEAARRVGEELVETCKQMDISEISCYDRNGFARGEKMMAFEIPIAQHGFLPR